MKSWLLLLALFGCLCAASARAATLDDQYVEIYQLMHDADTLQADGDPQGALDRYREAQNRLRKIQLQFPEWNDKLVKYRLNYLSEKMAGIHKLYPGGKYPEKKVTITQVPPVMPEKNDAAVLEVQVRTLTDELGRLKSEKSLVEAKLKEALSAQPRLADPGEVARAEARITALERERDLQKSGLEQERKKLAQQAEAVATLTQERDLLQARLKAREDKSEAKALRAENDQLKLQVADLNRRTATFAKLEDLDGQVRQSRAENEKLRLQLAEAEKKTALLPNINEISGELNQARADLLALKGRNESLQKENQKLEVLLNDPALGASPKQTEQLAKLQAEKAALERDKLQRETRNALETARVKNLEQERAEMERRLKTAYKELEERKRNSAAPKPARASREVETLRAKVAALEAKKTPYSAEELALFSPPQKTREPVILVADNGKVSRAAPKGAAPLIAEAQRAFAAQRYEEAEKKYLQALNLDEKNVVTLADLAVIQMQQNRLSDAETNLVKALALQPDDAYSVSLMGLLQFRQDKLDDAIGTLSRAAKLDPRNPQTQNYLGLAFSQKGQREPAEAAFRKAIQLAPNYAEGHYNLAVFYATQKPPTLELARWHYQKSLGLGGTKNGDLEKQLDAK